MRGRKPKLQKELIAEDFCFICKDGGDLRICDHRDCLKVYHPECVGKDISFLETGSYWKCGWHSCFLCKKSSNIKCICCPTSVCRTCIEDADFVQVKEKSMGFCAPCLKRAKQLEENTDAESDGENNDFNDASTYEDFKDYWNIVNGRLKISLEELQLAYSSLKNGCHFTCEYNSDDESEGEEIQSNMEVYANRNESKASFRKPCSRRRKIVGWGSQELLDFLISIGKDVQKPLSQTYTCELIKRYIWENNLLHPVKKKKKVLCDGKLYALFKKKSVKLLKIYDLLEGHFPEDSDDNSYWNSEDEQEVIPKRQKAGNHGNKVQTHQTSRISSESSKCSYAAVVDKNIRLIYVKRSLVQEFVKNPADFEDKLIGCFVRVKNDPEDFLYSNRIYKLGQVIGIKKTEPTMKSGEMDTNIVLRISTMFKDVHISWLSNDDFEEEECEELRELVKKGLHKRLMIEELEKKSALLYGDIMKHWISREIITLQKQIDRANEKGWRREVCELIERREQLCMPEEQARLLQIPEVIPDIEPIAECNLNSHLGTRERDEGANTAPDETVRNENGTRKQTEKNESVLKLISDKESEGANIVSDETVRHGNSTLGHTGKIEAIISKKESEGVNIASDALQQNLTVNEDDSVEKAENKSQGIQEGEQVNIVEKRDHPVDVQGSNKDSHVVEINEDDENHSCYIQKKPVQIEIINLDDDDDTNPTYCSPRVAKQDKSRLWNYLDPFGDVQGSFGLELLQIWRQHGFFDDNFKVWRSDQSQEEAILLTDALRGD